MRAAAIALLLCLVPPIDGFKPDIHEDITQQACETISHVIDGTTYQFQGNKEILEIRTANKDSDSLSGDFWNEAVHYDNEGLALCSRRIKNLKAAAVGALTGGGNPDGALARKFTGQALHTLQDFYAHSNWVELIGFGFRTNGINSDLGRMVMTNPAKSVEFCPDDLYELAAVNGVTTGYFMLPSSLSAAALYIPIPGSFVGTAYYETCQTYPKGKCRHGIDEISLICDGINKDTPARTGHALARSLAQLGSKDFIEQVLDDPGVKNNVDAVEAYLGPQGALAFAIDDTGSMGDDINAVISAVELLVSATDFTRFVLVRFGDPSVSGAFITTSKDAFLNKVRAIVPSGGGDCPEFSMTGLEVAIDATKRNSDVYVFTDASAKDASKAGLVINKAIDKKVRVSIVATGSCRRRMRALSHTDPVYTDITGSTGGALFEVDTADIEDIFAVVAPRTSGSFHVVYRSKGTIDAPPKDFNIQVDETISTAIFTIRLGSSSSSLFRPDMSLVVEGDEGVSFNIAGETLIITVDDPSTGEWLLQAEGSGFHDILVEGRSSLELFSFDFVELLYGRELAYDPVSGEPIAGKEQTALARMIGDFQSVSMWLVGEEGTFLQEITSMAPGTSPAPSDSLLGSFVVPEHPFGIAARGEVEMGQPFQRYYPGFFRPQSVSVDIDYEYIIGSGGGLTPAGTTTVVKFLVTNTLGEEINLNVDATDERLAVSSVTPSSLTLAPSETASLGVDLTPPACSFSGLIPNRLAVTISSEGTMNTKFVTLYTSCNQAPSCGSDQVDVAKTTLWPPNNKMVEIDVASAADITDPDGDEVMVSITSILQDEESEKKATSFDASGVGTSVASVRATRNGNGDARFYQINFRADDGKGGTCEGTLYVHVPHDQGGEDTAPGDFVYDSTGGGLRRHLLRG